MKYMLLFWVDDGTGSAAFVRAAPVRVGFDPAQI
jgi:hypothetical protein